MYINRIPRSIYTKGLYEILRITKGLDLRETILMSTSYFELFTDIFICISFHHYVLYNVFPKSFDNI